MERHVMASADSCSELLMTIQDYSKTPVGTGRAGVELSPSSTLNPNPLMMAKDITIYLQNMRVKGTMTIYIDNSKCPGGVNIAELSGVNQFQLQFDKRFEDKQGYCHLTMHNVDFVDVINVRKIKDCYIIGVRFVMKGYMLDPDIFKISHEAKRWFKYYGVNIYG